jgi:hypothetical protein
MKPAVQSALIVILAVSLAVTGISAVVVGVHDAALSHPGLGLTASSALLLVAGAILLLASYQLVGLSRRGAWRFGIRPPCEPPVLLGFLVMILIGIYVLLSALRSPGTQRTIVVAVAVLMIAVPLAGLYVFGRDARVTLPGVGAVAIGLVGTTFGAWQFWYQNQYVPAHAGRAVIDNVQLKRTARGKGYDLISATITYENVGSSGVSVIGSAYTLTGSRIVRCYRPATAKRVRKVFHGTLLDPQRSRFMADVEEKAVTVLAAGKFVADGKRLDPNVSTSRNVVFAVPQGHYQLLRFRAQLLAIPASVPLSQREKPTFTPRRGDNELYGYWHIDDDSWFHDLISGRERWIVLRYELVDPKKRTSTLVTPDLHVTARFPNPGWGDQRPDEAQPRSLFDQNQTGDTSEPFGDAELALGSVTSPIGREASSNACESADSGAGSLSAVSASGRSSAGSRR